MVGGDSVVLTKGLHDFVEVLDVIHDFSYQRVKPLPAPNKFGASLSERGTFGTLLVVDFFGLHYFLDVGDGIVDYSANFGVGQCAVDSEILECAG